jgi:hypothetical protein|nr:hypothetical protein [Methanosarcina sp. UBA411]
MTTINHKSCTSYFSSYFNSEFRSYFNSELCTTSFFPINPTIEAAITPSRNSKGCGKKNLEIDSYAATAGLKRIKNTIIKPSISSALP